jgi:hypothetical protein
MRTPSPLPPASVSAPFVRRDLIAMLPYVNSCPRSAKCVDGTFKVEFDLDRLAAAARMQ